jgi:hypothetical protein
MASNNIRGRQHIPAGLAAHFLESIHWQNQVRQYLFPKIPYYFFLVDPYYFPFCYLEDLTRVVQCVFYSSEVVIRQLP